jgi:hypothetical protein
MAFAPHLADRYDLILSHWLETAQGIGSIPGARLFVIDFICESE